MQLTVGSQHVQRLSFSNQDRRGGSAGANREVGNARMQETSNEFFEGGYNSGRLPLRRVPHKQDIERIVDQIEPRCTGCGAARLANDS